MDNMYHGIIINVSQKDQSIFSNIKIIGKHEVERLNWILYKVEIPTSDIDKIINELQLNIINKKYYFHFYRNNELIVIFKEKIFKVTTDKSTWKELINYGLSLNIPLKQLDFKPYRIEDETY